MSDEYTGFGTNFYWQQLLPMEIRTWAIVTIRKKAEERGDEYVDNYRAAEVGNQEQEERFMEAEENGCCGSYKFETVGPDGKTYVLGYNHGH